MSTRYGGCGNNTVGRHVDRCRWILAVGHTVSDRWHTLTDSQLDAAADSETAQYGQSLQQHITCIVTYDSSHLHNSIDLAVTMTSSYMPSCRHYYNYFFLFALVLHSQGLEISKYANVCPEWLRWGLGNCERVGKVHCIETLNCHRNILVHECTVCLKKNIPDIFSCNSRKHYRIFIMFGTHDTEKVSNQYVL